MRANRAQWSGRRACALVSFVAALVQRSPRLFGAYGQRGSTYVELICEVSGSQGSARFDLDSLKNA